MNGELLVYGAYGYSGALITRRAVDRGISPIIAGRRAEPLEAQATELDLEHRAFSLEHPSIVESQLEDVDVVLNCAGPFSATAEPMLDACLESGTHYLDLAGRITTLEALAQRDAEIAEADVTAIPAVGFDAVPTDCLAGILAESVDSPNQLTMALDGFGTFSPGTLKSIVETLDRPGAVRSDGVIEQVPLAWKTREFTFGVGEKPGVTVPWGTISTAYYSTGIENIETYVTLPEIAAQALRWGRPLVPLLSARPLRTVLEAVVDRFVSGPTPDERAQRTVRIWGEVTGEEESAVARLTTPEVYEFTATTAVESARRVLDDDVEHGFQTPVTAFGPEYVTEFDGVTLHRGLP